MERVAIGERTREIRLAVPTWALGSNGRTAGTGSLVRLRASSIGRGRAPDQQTAPVDRSSDARWSPDLPRPLTSFVGRDGELAEAARLLGTTRLLTLTGTGGVGKTRLAHEIAASLSHPAKPAERAMTVWQTPALPGRVHVVELAELTDPARVPWALAAVMGVRHAPDRSLTATLADRLRAEPCLLVLDNCEHLIDACAALADTLLRSCPELRILATSRQPLGIDGETTYRVPSLALAPEPDGPCASSRPESIDPDVVSEAARLFAERARAAMPTFALTDRNAATVEQICRRLDGIPLAIELAAARVGVLSLEQIAARLGDRFRLLTGGSRTALPRYRTLRALIDWSHDLLDERERTLLRRLAVFAGGWTLEAAESVCADDDLAPEEMLDLLSGLVEKSLVLPVEQAGEVRFGFLESLRAYAAEKLSEAAEESALRERHTRWFVALAERIEPELIGPRQEAFLDCLARDRENFRAAQRRAVEHGDDETAVRLGAALWRFWWARGDAAEARELIDAIVPLARQAPPTPALARALLGTSMIVVSQSDYATSRSLLEAGLAVARQLEDRQVLAALLDELGRQSFISGRHTEARALLEESLAIHREIGGGHGLVRTLSHLGFLEYLEDRLDSARAIYHEGLTLARQAGDPSSVAEFLDNLGRTYQADGELDGAERAFQEALVIWRETVQGHWLAMGLNNLGSVQTLRGDLSVARTHLEEALTLSRKIGNRRRLAFTLSAAATLAAVEGDPERAVRFDVVASAAVAEIGTSLTQPGTVPMLAHVAQARRALGASAVTAAELVGHATTLDAAVDEALEWLVAPARPAEITPLPVPQPFAPPPTLSAVPSVVAASPGGVGLSPRELEVAALVARGMTNRQIAAELVITEGTAANHVKHILARLVLDSRAQIAVWTVERGLHRSAPLPTNGLRHEVLAAHA